MAVVPPGSTDRFIAPPNQNYMNALLTIQSSLEGIANQPGVPNDAAAAQTVTNATQAKVNTRQMAQAFTIDAEGHIEANVQKLLEDPITYLDAMLRYQPHTGRPHERALVAQQLARQGVLVPPDQVEVCKAVLQIVYDNLK